jgi:hypothetical protein
MMPIKDDHRCSASPSLSPPDPSPLPPVAVGAAKALVHVGRVDPVKVMLIVAAQKTKKKLRKKRRKKKKKKKKK